MVMYSAFSTFVCVRVCVYSYINLLKLIVDDVLYFMYVNLYVCIHLHMGTGSDGGGRGISDDVDNKWYPRLVIFWLQLQKNL